MSTDRQRVFIFLDEKWSSDVAADFDSQQDILNYAIDDVSMRDDLCMGCGVGPLIPYIEEWVEIFCSKE